MTRVLCTHPRLWAVLFFVLMVAARRDDFSTYPKG